MHLNRRPKLGVALAMALGLTASYAHASDCTLKIKNFQVPKKVAAGDLYSVVMEYEQTGRPRIKSGQFWWSGEGPYKIDVKKQPGDEISSVLRTGNPNTYKLTVAIEYRCKGKTWLSNRLEKKLVVKPKG